MNVKKKKKKKNPPALPYFALARYSNTIIFFFWPYIKIRLGTILNLFIKKSLRNIRICACPGPIVTEVNVINDRNTSM